MKSVTPCVGVWIEIFCVKILLPQASVTPCVGVWIEIFNELPEILSGNCHSLRGSVD